jgi:hypothetical protein
MRAASRFQARGHVGPSRKRNELSHDAADTLAYQRIVRGEKEKCNGILSINRNRLPTVFRAG